jgi:hypothetical protein
LENAEKVIRGVVAEFGYDFFVPGMTVADLNAADFVGLDAPPCQTLPAGSEFSAPLFVSHWGEPIGASEVRWQLDFINRFGECQSVTEGKIATTPTRYTVTDLGALRCTLPNETGLATLALWLEDESGQDEKIVAVPIDKLHPFYSNVKSYLDLPEIMRDQFAHFFEHYKDLEKNKWVKVSKWVGTEEAKDLIRAGIANANKKAA